MEKKGEISNFALSCSLTVNEHKISARLLGYWVPLAVNQRHSLKKDFLYVQNPTKPFEPRGDAWDFLVSVILRATKF